jgi:Uma2 family endonuclease
VSEPKTDSIDDEVDLDAPAGHRLGDYIALHDLLALPPDGGRYTRDASGRLAFMSPDSHRRHRRPLAALAHLLNRHLEPPRFDVFPEPSIALPRIFGRRGALLPESEHGPKVVEPDLAVFAGEAVALADRDVTAPDGLRLVIEILSPRTFRCDLGLPTRGKRDDVDLWRTYLESGVREYWAINAGTERAPIPPRSGLFLKNVGGEWRPLGGEGLVEVGSFRELPAHGRGVVKSAAVRGLTLDLTAFWKRACR